MKKSKSKSHPVRRPSSVANSKARRRRQKRQMGMERLENRELLAADFSVNLDAPRIEGDVLTSIKAGTPDSLLHLIAAQTGSKLVRRYENFDAAQFRLVSASSGGDGGGNTSREDGAAGGDGSSNGDFVGNVPALTIDILEAFEAYDNILVAEPNYVMESRYVPNDPQLSQQYGLINTGQTDLADPLLNGKIDADIDADEAWDKGNGSNVVIAVIDSGIDEAHRDLQGNHWVNTGEIPGNGLDDDMNGAIDDVHGHNFTDAGRTPDIQDGDGHGTHVSGVAAAIGDNDEGIVGVAWGAKIMTLRSASLSVASTSDALDYLVSRKLEGVNVVASNNSYGSHTPSVIQELAIQASTDVGVLFVAAVDNSGMNSDFDNDVPPGYPNDRIVAVGSTDRHDEISSFSAFGRVVTDLHAPGEQNYSTKRPADSATGYDFGDGTSFATPAVTGAIAVLAGLDPTASPDDLKRFILNGADPLASLTGLSVTGARLNLNSAIEQIPRGQIRGRIFDDQNSNGIQDRNEPGVGGATVLLDRDGDGVLDPFGELQVLADANGDYVFENYWYDGIEIVVALPGGTPFPDPAPVPVTGIVRPGDATIDFPLGRPQAGELSGFVFNDKDSNGTQTTFALAATAADVEEGVGGVYVFIDENGDDKLQISEPVVVTEADGGYNFLEHYALLPRVHTVRTIVPPGWTLTAPQSNERIAITGNSSAGITDLNFGIVGGDAFDFGDLGDQTTLAQDGPRHGVLTGFHLGTDNTREVDAVATDTGDDGVTVTSTVFAGGTVTADVTVSLGGFRPGYLQTWVDENNDGIFTDSEQVIANQRLMEGTHEVSFVLPETAVSGGVAARFRYGWEFGIGPTGSALAGEVEDYILNVAGDTPLAIADRFSVDENTSANTLAVLANDFASSSGGLFVQSIDTSTTSGTVAISADMQTLEYTPRPSFSGTDTLTYTVSDDSGLTATAGVTITVLPTFSQPVAVDDQETVAINSPGTAINALGNDLPGSNGPLSITAIIAGPTNGSVVFDSTSVTYTPSQNYQGIDQFTYQVSDGIGVTSTAVVTTFVGDATSDDSLAYFAEFTTLDGVTPLPNNQVTLGGDFLVNIYVQDIRPTTTQLPEADHGVFAGFVDVLYPAGAVSLEGALAFNGDYTVVLDQANTLIPGIIDEAGAVRDISEIEPGSDKKLLFRAPFRANALGVVTFVPNPADEVGTAAPQTFGDHDTLIYNPTTHVLPNDISYLPNTLTVVANGEGAQHNSLNPTDINADGRTNSVDAALAVGGLRAKANGESIVLYRSTGNAVYYDVTGEGYLSPHDLVAIVSEIHRQHNVSGHAEPGDILGVQLASGEPIDFSSLPSSSTPNSNLPTDQSVSRNEESSALYFGSSNSDNDTALLEIVESSSDVEEDDDFFSDISSGKE